MIKPFDPIEFWNSIPNEDSPSWPVICVDFNGVLDQYTGWTGEVRYTPPAIGVKQFLCELRKYFNTVVIFTATMPLEDVETWLILHNLDGYVDYVTNHKVPAEVYVDDRAVCHRGNFNETLQQAISFDPHWKK